VEEIRSQKVFLVLRISAAPPACASHFFATTCPPAWGFNFSATAPARASCFFDHPAYPRFMFFYHPAGSLQLLIFFKSRNPVNGDKNEKLFLVSVVLTNEHKILTFLSVV
jgi:hypothetical protein